jgi:hypothetical protein
MLRRAPVSIVLAARCVTGLLPAQPPTPLPPPVPPAATVARERAATSQEPRLRGSEPLFPEDFEAERETPWATLPMG